jgi:tetratricopeptide (TPR) repeat protein
MNTGGNTQLPMNVSGKFLMEDGTPPHERLDIELLCPPNTQMQGKTDLDGGFNLELGYGRFEGAEDAGMRSAAAKTGFGGQLSVGRTYQQVDGASVIALIGCFLKADMGGYESDQYDLGKLRAGDVNTNIGTLFLHPVGGDAASAVSATSAAAPKDAQKSLVKARDYVFKRQFGEAEAELKKAVKSYPKYAEAWNDLGGVLESEHKNPEARQAYQQSIASDARFSRPYLNLARLSATEKKWSDVAEQAAALAKLNPEAFPQSYYYNAVAQYNLGNDAKAIESAQHAVKLDAGHKVPLAEQLLGMLYAMRGDYKSAAEQYRNYLQHVPLDTNVDSAKQRLAEAEKQIAANGAK